MRSLIGNNDSCMPPLWLMPYRLDSAIGIALVLLGNLTWL